MSKEKKIYYSDLTTLVEVCYSCSSQNISITDNGEKSFCKDCGSEDIGAEFPKDLI
jgi:anaerobic ribonucleoside-triphosphate reductase